MSGSRVDFEGGLLVEVGLALQVDFKQEYVAEAALLAHAALSADDDDCLAVHRRGGVAAETHRRRRRGLNIAKAVN